MKQDFFFFLTMEGILSDMCTKKKCLETVNRGYFRTRHNWGPFERMILLEKHYVYIYLPCEMSFSEHLGKYPCTESMNFHYAF